MLRKLTILITSCFLLFPINVIAQTPYRGTVIRLVGTFEPYYDIHLDPGATYNGEFIVQHEYENPDQLVELYIDASDFDYDPLTGTTVYPTDSYKFNNQQSLVDWIKFDRQTVKLTKYGQSEHVKFTVTVPKNAAPGAKYANILVSNTKKELITGQQQLNLDTQGAGIASRIVAATLIVTVNGSVTQDVSISSVKVTSMNGDPGLFGFIHSIHPITITTTIQNYGNQVFLPGGNVFIHQGDKTKPIYTEELNHSRYRVLPGSKRNFEDIWSDSVIQWDNGIKIRLANFPQLNWGRYYAEVDLLYRDVHGQFASQTQTIEFWVLPWQLILIVILVVLGYVAYRLYKRGNKVAKSHKKSSKWPGLHRFRQVRSPKSSVPKP